MTQVVASLVSHNTWTEAELLLALRGAYPQHSHCLARQPS